MEFKHSKKRLKKAYMLYATGLHTRTLKSDTVSKEVYSKNSGIENNEIWVKNHNAHSRYHGEEDNRGSPVSERL